MADLNTTIDRASSISRAVGTVLERRLRSANERYAGATRKAVAEYLASPPLPKSPLELWQEAWNYGVDAAQRSVLFWDTLRQRGNDWLAHEAAGKPPLLHYEYELLADGRKLARPVNYALVRIVPPAGVAIDDTLRPFIIIDPRSASVRWLPSFARCCPSASRRAGRRGDRSRRSARRRAPDEARRDFGKRRCHN